MKRKLLKWGIWLLVILLVCGAVFLMPSGSRVSYGIEKGSVNFTDVEFDITDSVLGAEKYLAAKNERFELYLDSNYRSRYCERKKLERGFVRRRIFRRKIQLVLKSRFL